MGRADAIAAASEFVAQSGYAGAQIEGAEPLTPDVWCVRFGLAPKGSGRKLEIHLDATSWRVVSHRESKVVSGDLPNRR